MITSNVNLEALMRAQFEAAKYWWGITTGCRLLVVAINIFTTFVSLFTEGLALFAALLTVAYALAQWRSDRLKSVANSILSKIEMYDGLGWPVTGKELSDLLVIIPHSVKLEAAKSADAAPNYFASKEAKFPKRLMENLEESSWLAKHQSRRMAQYIGILSALIFLIAIITLTISLQSTLNQVSAANIAKVIITIIVFMFSGGYVRLSFDYHHFATEAERIENSVHSLLMENDISEIRAIKLLHDYQVVRAGSPLLPTWLWKMMSQELNSLWEQYRRLEGSKIDQLEAPK